MAATKTNGRKKLEDGQEEMIANTVADIRSFEIPSLDVREATLHCVGISPLIVHRFSEKSRKEMEAKTTGAARAKKPLREPEQEWRDACYVDPERASMPDWEPGKYHFPAAAFKHAFLYGVAQMQDTKKLPKTLATGWFFPTSDPILRFESVTLREDVVRVSGTAMVAYRPQFNDWSVDVDIDYDAGKIRLEQIVTLLDSGGFAGGIGEWRPSAPKNKTGSFGRFHVMGATTR